MSETYKSRAIVLHTIKYGDNGHIVHLYTEALGRRSYYVGGLRNGRLTVGRNKIALQPLTVVDIVGYPGQRSDLHRLREASTPYLLASLPFDVRKSAIALFMAETVYRIVREEGPNPLFFDFFEGAIKALDEATDGVANFHIYFLLEMTRFMGYYPSDNYSPGAFFDLSRGEFVVIKPHDPDVYMDRRESEILASFIGRSLGEVLCIAMGRAERVALLGGLIRFLSYHHDSAYKISSIKILGEIF